MFSMNSRALFWCALTLSTAASYAGDTWKGAQIMPKSVGLVLEVGGRAPAPPASRGSALLDRGVTGTVYDVAWPARVLVEEGQWLWIEDYSGYSVPPKRGWVSTEDALRFDDPERLKEPFAYYTNQARISNEPWLHWLIGICLEREEETVGAREEYRTAFEADGGLFDAKVRFWRLKAMSAGSAAEAQAAAEKIQGIGTRIPSRPCVALAEAEAWEKASQAAYRRGDCEAKAKELFEKADRAYESAINKDDRNCPLGYLGRAELYLTTACFLRQRPQRSDTGVPGTGGVPAAAAAPGPRPPDSFRPGDSPEMLRTLLRPRKEREPEQKAKPSEAKLESKPEGLPAGTSGAIDLAERAILLFHNAITRDPGLVQAYCGRAAAYVLLANTDQDVVDARAHFDSAFDEALVANEVRVRFTNNKVAVCEGARQLAKKPLDKQPGTESECVAQVRRYAATLGDLTAEADTLAKSNDDECKKTSRDVNDIRRALGNNKDLARAKESAVAGYKINPARVRSLTVLASVYAALCDYDRAERCQRLAVIYAPDEDRPELLVDLDAYREHVLSRRLNPR
jgi:tetratricopeptide (TPR) repeat protein